MLNRRQSLISLLTLTILACQAEVLVQSPDEPAPPPPFASIAIRVLVDVASGTVSVVEPESPSAPDDGLAHAILGTNEVSVTTGNMTRTNQPNNRALVTFDAALTNRLTASSLIPSTFPALKSPGLVLFPLQITSVVGGTAAQVVESPDWNGDGTTGSGAPRSFFNDVNCTNAATSDCIRWEQYPAPLYAGESTAPQRVGFLMPRAVRSFTVLMVLAADISNDLEPVARLTVTPPNDTMSDGFSAPFSAVAYDVRGNPLPWAIIRWTTADPTAVQFRYGSALVNQFTGPNVVVDGRKVGLTSITARSGGVSVVVPITVRVNTIVLIQPYILPDSQLTAGEVVEALASVKDNSGQIVDGIPVVWTTSDPTVATVVSTGPISATIRAVGAGTVNIFATAAGATGVIPIGVRAAPFGDITGILRDQNDSPVAGAAVRAVGAGADVTVTTGPDGRYRFSSLPVGPYQLISTPANCGGVDVRTSVLPGQTTERDLSVTCSPPPPPPSLVGTVVDADGGPVAGATVDAILSSTQFWVTTTNAAGAYVFSNLPPGNYGMTAAKTGSCSPDFGLTQVLAGQTTTANYHLDCPSMLTGRVDFIGTFPVAFPGSLTVQVQANGNTTSAPIGPTGSYSIPLPSGSQVDLSLSGVPGTCFETTGGIALGNVVQQQHRTQDWIVNCRQAELWVGLGDGVLMPLIEVSVTVMPDNITVKTDQWGNAYFKSITTGVKQISATPTANTACAVDWSGEATVVRGEITMTGSALNCGSGEGGIFALVRSPRGDPVGGVEFQVGRFTVITNDQGIFQVGGLPVGDVVVLRLFGASCPDLGKPETVRVLPGTAVAANQFCP